MRRYILLTLLLSCLHIATRGQTIADIDLSGLPEQTQAKSMRYWFDDDDSSVKAISHLKGSKKLDVSSLVDGLHTLHYQVIDNKNTVAYICSSLFLKVGQTTTSAQAIRYWFDDEKSSSTTIAANNGFQSISTASLLDGIHTIHYQVMGGNGQAYYIASGIFFKSGNGEDGNVTAKQLMYWFDDETSFHKIDMSSGVQMIDASSLIEGLHTLHYQVLCSNGMITPAQSSVFMRLNFDVETAAAKSLRYWFDDEKTATEETITQGVQMLDATRLTDGLHTVHYQVVDNRGTLGAPVSSVFMKMITSANSQAKKIRYWFDDDTTTLKVIDVNTGTQQIDVSNLLTGIHTLYYQLVDGEGKVGVPVAGLFLKNFDKVIEGGVNKITQYQYWLNKNSESMETVKVNNAANPYKLISLLPVQKEPFHSDCFHFEVNDGVPAAYAKNIFHIRFHDAQGYFSDKDAPFIDYSVKQEVNNPKLLTSGKRETFARPQENEIKWYRLEAEPGDSLQFCLDRACSMQLFSPSGKEIHAVSGSESVEWNGLHVFESGTYYLALHDMTATNGSQLNLDYEHIDKYAILRQDVTTVGNGGCSTITFDGNGFKNLYAVDLMKGSTTINHAYLDFISDAQTALTFDFSDAALGDYKAVFHFADEDRTVEKCIKVETAKDITLDLDVSYPATFLRGTSTTYTVKITNKGNMTAYAVPIYTWIKSKTLDGVYNIKYEGLELAGVFDGIDTDSLSQSEIEELRSFAAQCDDGHHFLKIHIEDEEHPGDSIYVRTNYFFTNLGPFETKTLRLTISTREDDVYAYFTVPEDWPSIGKKIDSNIAKQIAVRYRVGSLKDKYCCIKEKVECYASVMANTAGLINLLIDFLPDTPHTEIVKISAHIVDCLYNVLETTISAIGNFMCGSDDNTEKNFFERLKSIRGSISNSGVIWSCLEAFVPKAKFIRYIRRAGKTADISDILGFGQLNADCRKAFSSPKPSCPPLPNNNGGGSSTPVTPVDPNEIYGYLAPSGSNAVKRDLRDVYYTIQFENDTTFATASAHEVFVRDTLDSKKFDLKTFAPTAIRIGDKTVQLDGQPNFVKTIDMRPNIYAIAQVECQYNQQKGIAEWHFSSLDPMTMEPTDDVMSGFLPVNFDGNGIGEVSFDIKLKPGLADGTLVPNQAGIVFDHNDVIMTPAWENIIDMYAPESHVTEVIIDTDTTALVKMEATDNLSGVWKYDVYVQYGEGAAWFPEALDVPADQMARVRYYEGVATQYLTVAYDMAGNKEFRQVLNPEMGTATGIADIKYSDGGSDIYYDLQGRKMTKKPQRGIFIRNKKKFVAQ